MTLQLSTSKCIGCNGVNSLIDLLPPELAKFYENSVGYSVFTNENAKNLKHEKLNLEYNFVPRNEDFVFNFKSNPDLFKFNFKGTDFVNPFAGRSDFKFDLNFKPYEFNYPKPAKNDETGTDPTPNPNPPVDDDKGTDPTPEPTPEPNPPVDDDKGTDPTPDPTPDPDPPVDDNDNGKDPTPEKTPELTPESTPEPKKDSSSQSRSRAHR